MNIAMRSQQEARETMGIMTTMLHPLVEDDLTTLETRNRAMALLPDELTAEYREACRFVPELVEKESDPRWFLSFHPSDPLAAAKRLANYWKKRKEIFQERAFLPINLSGNNGALTADDVQLLKTGYTVNLPRDKKNRSVLYIDISKRRPETTPSLRIIFFIGQSVMENENTRTDCFVGLYNISNPYAVDFDKKNHECAGFLMKECMPVKQIAIHLCYISSPGMNIMPLFVNTVFTWAVNFLVFYFGKSIVAHIASCKEECLTRLLEYDFSPDGLPVGLGGSWAGGCEPWRRKGTTRPRPGGGGGGGTDDDDELTLEIETDLTCLLRNSLWLHNQTVSCEANEPSEHSDCSKMQHGSSTNHHQHHHHQLKAVSASSVAVTPAAPVAPAAVVHYPIPNESDEHIIKRTRRVVLSKRQECGMKEDNRQRVHVRVENTSNSYTVLAGAAKKGRHAAVQVTEVVVEDKKARRRRMHAEADRVRRAKERSEIEALQEQCLRMSKMNQSLVEEQRRLQRLAQAAIDMTAECL